MADYRVTQKDRLTVELLNSRFLDINDRLTAAEVARLSEDEAFAAVLDRVLVRSDNVISDLRNKLLAITQLQWLTANSSTSRTLESDAEFSLSITADQRELFTPGPFALLSWTGGEPDDYAIVRTLGYDRDLGQWDVRVEAFTGDAGPHDDWQIAAVAGATLAQMALVDQGQAALADTVAARDLALEYRDAAAESEAAAAAARDITTVARDVTTAARDTAIEARDAAIDAAQAAADSAASIDGAAIAAQLANHADRLTTLEVDAWFYS